MAEPPAYTWQDHVAHAEHNERVLAYLIKAVIPKEPEFADWALVVCFYVAFHYTKAAIFRDHRISVPMHRGHMGSNGWVDGHNDLVRRHLPSISAEYRDLFDIGSQARYEGFYTLGNKTVLEVVGQQLALAKIKQACGF